MSWSVLSFDAVMDALMGSVSDPGPFALALAGLGMAIMMWRRCSAPQH